MLLAPRGNGPPPLTFHQGAHPPYAIRWFGVTSLFGHARHFAASAIASESVDARDWMRPQTPDELLDALAAAVGAAGAAGATLCERIGRPVWIDFVADTGDDRDVSVAVARWIFEEYTLDGRALPRGDLLLFGGDTAYPVATADEIEARLLEPWNEVLAERANDGVPRAVLAIPGNHDWYDGLDGFARLFRRSVAGRRHAGGGARAAAQGARSRRGARRGRGAGLVVRQLQLDEVRGLVGLVVGLWRSVRAFFRGGSVKRVGRLELAGYEAVQEASYWALPLATGLELWGADRQLRKVDFRQRAFFRERRDATPRARVLLVGPDPALAFGERHDLGARVMSACRLSFEHDEVFYLAGDVHHYERRPLGKSLHVIAGGGGAFVHGTRIRPGPGGPPAAAFPDAATSRLLVAQVPVKLMAGKAGLLAHLTFALLASLELGVGVVGRYAFAASAWVVTAAAIAGLYFVAGHHRAHVRKTAALCVPFGLALGLLPYVLRRTLPHVLPHLARDGVVVLVSAFGGAFLFGLFLTVLAITGLEHQQAFSVLGHPGFKHFVRMCVHPDGKIEAWTIGKDDPLDATEPVLIDRFDW